MSTGWLLALTSSSSMAVTAWLDIFDDGGVARFFQPATNTWVKTGFSKACGHA